MQDDERCRRAYDYAFDTRNYIHDTVEKLFEITGALNRVMNCILAEGIQGRDAISLVEQSMTMIEKLEAINIGEEVKKMRYNMCALDDEQTIDEVELKLRSK